MGGGPPIGGVGTAISGRTEQRELARRCSAHGSLYLDDWTGLIDRVVDWTGLDIVRMIVVWTGYILILIGALFTSHANLKYFLFHPSHRIFERIYRTLNVGKKITNYIVCR
jgi:hypothetical protein